MGSARVRRFSDRAALAGASLTLDCRTATKACVSSDLAGTSRTILGSSDGTNFITIVAAPTAFEVLNPCPAYVRVTQVGAAEETQIEAVREIS